MQHDRFMASYKTRSVASAVILDFLPCILTIILQSTIKHTLHSLTPNLPDHLISSPCQHPWIISATWVYPMNPLRKHYYIDQCTCDIVVLFLSKLQANPAWLLQHKVITVILNLMDTPFPWNCSLQELHYLLEWEALALGAAPCVCCHLAMDKITLFESRGHLGWASLGASPDRLWPVF